MAKTISSLSVALGATISPLQKAFAGAAASVESAKSSIASTAGTMLKFTGVGAAVATGMGAVQGVFGSLGDSISLASQLEQNQVAFETMTGSAEKAKSLMGEIGTFAAETPFEFPELASSAKKLLAFGTSADQIVPTMRALGDISSGIGAPLNEIAELFGKAKVQGTLMAEEINQLVGRGIPVIQQFAKQLGVTEGEVKEMASKGKINFAMLQKAVVDMTGEGGQFSGMMAKQSQTLGGLWSTFTDGISMSMAGMVTTIVDAFHLKGAIAALTGFTGTLGSWLQSAVGTVAPIVMKAGGAVVSAISGVVGRVYGVVEPVVVGVANVFAAAWPAIADTAVGVFNGVYGAVSAAFTGIYNFVAPIVSSVASVVSSAWLPMVTTVIGYFNSIYNVVSSTLTAAWAVVQTVGTGIATAWTWAMDALGLSSTTAAGAVGGAFDGMVKGVQWFYDTVTLALNVVAFGVRNFQDVIAAAMLASAYSVVAGGNQIAYVFTDVIPGYLTWFGRNWTSILTDAASFLGTVFSNMLTNAANFGRALWSAIKGDGFNFEFIGLTEGFKSTLSELPQIAERQVGPLEQTLGDASAAMNRQLSQGLGEYLAEQDAKTKAAADAVKKTFDGIGQSIADATNPKTVGSMAGDVAEFWNEAANPSGQLKIDNKSANAAIDATKTKADGLKAVVSGSGEAMQLQAQAQFAAMLKPLSAAPKPIAPPTPQPAPVPPSTLAASKSDKADTDLVAAILAKFPEIKSALDKIATNTGKVQTQTAAML